MPLMLARRSHQMITEQSKQLDKELLDGLERVGFRLDLGDDGTGWRLVQQSLEIGGAAAAERDGCGCDGGLRFVGSDGGERKAQRREKQGCAGNLHDD